MSGIDLAIGIDVGHSASRRSTGVVMIDRATKQLAQGSSAAVTTAAAAIAHVRAELSRLQPRSVAMCIDGSFAGGTPPRKARLVEKFFSSGPFAGAPGIGPKLRLCPAPTSSTSRFLTATRAIIDAMRADGHRPMQLVETSLRGNVVEIFPTIFLGALVAPREYTGKRGVHTDELWLRAIGPQSSPTHPALVPYAPMITVIEALPRSALHDARAAATAAVAADWFASSPPGSGPNAVMFIGTDDELGFVLPPRAACDPDFLGLLDAHWREASNKLRGLVWL